MGRGKVEMKRIENRVNRQVTFSKRRKGLLKKAHELAVLCDVQLGVIIFSDTGKLFEYCSPSCSLSDLIHRYEARTNPQLQEAYRNDQQMLAEIAKLTNEKEQLESSLKIYTGQDLSSLGSADELSDLEQHLQIALSKVRQRKHELLDQLLGDLRRKSGESGHGAATAAGVEMDGVSPPPPRSPSTSSGSFFPMEPVSASSTALQLWPQPYSFGGSSPPTCRTPASPGRGLQLW